MIQINRIDEYQRTRGIRLSENKLYTFLSSSSSLSWKMNIDYVDKKDMLQILTVFCKDP